MLLVASYYMYTNQISVPALMRHRLACSVQGIRHMALPLDDDWGLKGLEDMCLQGTNFSIVCG